MHQAIRAAILIAAPVIILVLGNTGVFDANIPIITNVPTSVAPTTLTPTRLPTSLPTSHPTTLSPTTA